MVELEDAVTRTNSSATQRGVKAGRNGKPKVTQWVQSFLLKAPRMIRHARAIPNTSPNSATFIESTTRQRYNKHLSGSVMHHARAGDNNYW